MVIKLNESSHEIEVTQKFKYIGRDAIIGSKHRFS